MMETISTFVITRSSADLPAAKKPAKRIPILILEGMALLAYASALPVLYSMMANGEDIKSFFCQPHVTDLNPAAFPDFGWLAPCAAVASALFLGYAFVAELIDVLKESGKCTGQLGLPKGKLFTFGFWATALLCSTLYFLKFGGSSMQYLTTLPTTPIPGSEFGTDIMLVECLIILCIMPIWIVNCPIVCCFAATGWKRPSGKLFSNLACWFRTHSCLRWMALSVNLVCPAALVVLFAALYLAVLIPFMVILVMLLIIFLPSAIKNSL